MIPLYEQSSGDKIAPQYSPAAVIAKKIEEGEEFDVAITNPGALDKFPKLGVVLMQPLLVVGVNSVLLVHKIGAPKPDISTPEALKATLLSAKAISFSDPAAGGGSSNYFMSVVEAIGITAQVKEKAIITKPAEAAFPVADGRAEIGVSQTSEAAMASGVETQPLNPSDPKSSSVYSAAISSKSQQLDASRTFVGFMSSPTGLAIRRAKGLAPL